MKLKLFFSILFAAALVTGCGSKPAGTEANSGADTSKKEPVVNASAGVQDLSVETPENKMDREDILIAVRKELANLKLPQAFKVTSIKEKDGFAFVRVEVTQEDGSPYQISNPSQDCCEVSGIFQLAASQWVALESNAFATDVWYQCKWKEFNTPREIFPPGGDDECM